MPIYEYRCDDCGTKFEKLVRRAAVGEVGEVGQAVLACPSCGQTRLKQEFSTFAAHANAGTKSAAPPACPGGMCRNPGMCGMDFN
jgi:putative FmdB family regulatory protein